MRQAGRNGTDLLLSPSLEWRAIDPMHANIAVYRAIENGVVVVRQADNGPSIVADPYGRMVAAMDRFTASERVLGPCACAGACLHALRSAICSAGWRSSGW